MGTMRGGSKGWYWNSSGAPNPESWGQGRLPGRSDVSGESSGWEWAKWRRDRRWKQTLQQREQQRPRRLGKPWGKCKEVEQEWRLSSRRGGGGPAKIPDWTHEKPYHKQPCNSNYNSGHALRACWVLGTELSPARVLFNPHDNPVRWVLSITILNLLTGCVKWLSWEHTEGKWWSRHWSPRAHITHALKHKPWIACDPS